MPKPEIVNNEIHKSLRVITTRGAEYGENIHFVPVIADELRSAVLDYPVVLMKDTETGRFGLFALLGFEPGENLFLDGSTWDAGYVPLHFRRQPFMVGYAAGEGEQPNPDKSMITIDMDSKRVQESEGEALFNADGSWTTYLQDVSRMLGMMIQGTALTDAFVNELAERDFIEPVQLNITFPGGESKNYEGLYSVNDEKLNELSADELKDLHERGFLQASYLMLASIGNIQKLIDRKSKRTATAG